MAIIGLLKLTHLALNNGIGNLEELMPKICTLFAKQTMAGLFLVAFRPQIAVVIKHKILLADTITGLLKPIQPVTSCGINNSEATKVTKCRPFALLKMGGVY